MSKSGSEKCAWTSKEDETWRDPEGTCLILEQVWRRVSIYHNGRPTAERDGAEWIAGSNSHCKQTDNLLTQKLKTRSCECATCGEVCTDEHRTWQRKRDTSRRKVHTAIQVHVGEGTHSVWNAVDPRRDTRKEWTYKLSLICLEGALQENNMKRQRDEETRCVFQTHEG